MKRISLYFLTFILLITAASVQAKTEVPGLKSPYVVIIDDEIDLLTDAEETKLIEQMMPITQYGTIVFHTLNQRPASDESIARDYLSSRVSGDRHFSCASLHINMGTRQLWMESRGKLEKIIDMSNAHRITGDVAYQATRGNYYECASEAFQKIITLAEGNRVISPMQICCSIMMAAALALLISIRIVYGTWKLSKTEMVLPLAAASISIGILGEKYIHETKIKLSSKSGSSCSGGGSSCGGGGSSCGGGGSSCGGGGSSCGSGGGSGF